MRSRVAVAVVGAAVFLCAGLAASGSAGDGATWRVVKVPNPSATRNVLLGVTAVRGRVWAGGFFNNASGHARSWVLKHRRGSGWVRQHVPRWPGGNRIYAVDARSRSDVWAVGAHHDLTYHSDGALILHKNAAGWKRVLEPFTRAPTQRGTGVVLDSVAAVAANDAWAVGWEYPCPASYCQHPFIGHWDGSAWSRVALPMATADTYGSLSGIAAVDATHIWAIGVDDDTDLPLILRWNGTAWHQVPSPVAQGSLSAATATSAHNVWAVGAVGATTLVVHFDGHGWKRVPTPTRRARSARSGVVALSPDDIWAIGGYGKYTQKPLIEHYDGSAWAFHTAPSIAADYVVLTDLARTSAATLVAVGWRSYTPSGPGPAITKAFVLHCCN